MVGLCRPFNSRPFCECPTIGRNKKRVQPIRCVDPTVRMDEHSHYVLFGDLGRQRLAHPFVGVVSPHALSRCVFQNTILRPCYVFRDILEFLPYFGSKLIHML